jgi:hypothetical protein
LRQIKHTATAMREVWLPVVCVFFWITNKVLILILEQSLLPASEISWRQEINPPLIS